MIQPGIYRHYKGKEYQVIGWGKKEDTLEDMVIYKPLYHTDEFPADMMRIRSLKVFAETVEYEGEIVPRFEYIKPL